MGNEILSEVKLPQLFGLVLAGGFSARMQQDKALMILDGEYMYQVALHLLDHVCPQVYISCRVEQSRNFKNCHLIPDAFPPKGPVTGILSAQKFNAEVAWLVIPVDMPNLTREFIDNNLIAGRDPSKNVTLLKAREDRYTQPLVAIYEPSSHLFLAQNYQKGNYSLTAILAQINIKVIEIDDLQNCLRNYNSPEDWS